MTHHRTLLAGMLLLATMLAGCFPFVAPRARTTPPPSGAAPSEASVLVIVYPATDNASFFGWVDILTQEGEALARLLPGTWTTLTRAPGRHRLLLVTTGGPTACVGGPNTSVAVLDAELIAGRYAHIMVEVQRPTLAAVMSAMCCSAEADTEYIWLNLVRVPLLGAGRDAALEVMEHGGAVEPLPRGMISPFADEVRRLATEREAARCFDPATSRVRREDQTRLPITEENALAF